MFDRSWVIVGPAGGGNAMVVPVRGLAIPEGFPNLRLCAWRTNFGGGSSAPPLAMFYGAIDSAEVTQRIGTGAALMDCLLVVPNGGIAETGFDSGERDVTVAWLSSAGGAAAPDVMQFRIYQI